MTIVGCNSSRDIPESIEETIYPASATVYTIDPSNSRAQYRVKEEFLVDGESLFDNGAEFRLGRVSTTGSTRDISGEIAIDFTQMPPSIAGGEITVDLVSLRTNQPARDEIIRTRWLESRQFPKATLLIQPQIIQFLGDPVYQDGKQMSFALPAELTIRETTRKIALVAKATVSEDRGVVIGSAEAPLKLTDFGIEPPSLANLVTVEDNFVLSVSLQMNSE